MRGILIAFLFMAVATGLISTETHASQQIVESTTEKIETKELISESMTFEQMIEQIARDYGISVNDAKEKIGYSDIMVKKAIQSKATYRILSQMFTVNSLYKPTMRFYCETSESGSFRAIRRIIEVNMIRGYNGLSKQFSAKGVFGEQYLIEYAGTLLVHSLAILFLAFSLNRFIDTIHVISSASKN